MKIFYRPEFSTIELRGGRGGLKTIEVFIDDERYGIFDANRCRSAPLGLGRESGNDRYVAIDQTFIRSGAVIRCHVTSTWGEYEAEIAVEYAPENANIAGDECGQDFADLYKSWVASPPTTYGAIDDDTLMSVRWSSYAHQMAPETFVDLMFHLILGRAAKHTPGMSFYLDQIRSGTPIHDLVRRAAHSTEAQRNAKSHLRDVTAVEGLLKALSQD